MNKTLTALYDSFYTLPRLSDTRAEIEAIHGQLCLRVLTVWRLENELNSCPENGRPTRSDQAGQDARCAPQERWELPDEG